MEFDSKTLPRNHLSSDQDPQTEDNGPVQERSQLQYTMVERTPEQAQGLGDG